MRLTEQEYQDLIAHNRKLKKPNKYRNIPTEYDGKRFDSKAEYKRYLALKSKYVTGEITELVVHPAFRIEVNGELLCTYIGDFSYREKGIYVLEDVKAIRTPIFNLKRKMMRVIKGIEITMINVKSKKRKKP